MQDLASAVLSRRYEEQLFQQVSSQNRGMAVAELQARLLHFSSSSCSAEAQLQQWATEFDPSTALLLQLCLHWSSQAFLALARLRCCSTCWQHAGESGI
jgi:hypothetical protein